MTTPNDLPAQAVNATSFNYSVDQQVSVNAFIDIEINGEPVRFQITSRYNSTAEKIVKTTKASIEAFALIRAEYPKPSQPAQPAKSETVKAETTGTELQTLEVVKMETTPKPENKVELKLYAANHQYPDLYHNGTVEQVLAALSGTGLEWKREQLTVAASYDVKFLADWRNSEKLNKNGKPYKNIVNYRDTEAPF